MMDRAQGVAGVLQMLLAPEAVLEQAFVSLTGSAPVEVSLKVTAVWTGEVAERV